MNNPRPDETTTADARGRVALDVVYRLLGADALPLDAALAELGRAFVASVGLACIVEGRTALRQRMARREVPPHWLWDERPELLEQIASAATAVAVSDGVTHYLLAGHGLPDEGGWLLWLEDKPPRAWDAGERAALQLAALALGRALTAGALHPQAQRWRENARLRQRLEDTALVTGRLAHDYGNVLTGVLGFTELSLAQIQPGTAPHRFLTEAHDAAQQGVRLTNRLKQFGRRTPTSRKPTALADVVRDALSNYRSRYEHAASWEAAVPNDLPSVALDAEPLRNVLGHLLDNASEAVVAGGTVTLLARGVELTEADAADLLGDPPPGSYVSLAVRDTGRGFSPDARRRAFAEPFFSTKPRHRGMGLASIYGIISSNGGGLRLEHGDPPGTTVTVYLPAARADAPRPQAGVCNPLLIPMNATRRMTRG